MNVQIKPFKPELRSVWDDFVRTSKNGYFLFYRGYMEYHADRFDDASLMFYKGDELLAVLPASRHDSVLRSHGGLTFGGLLLHPRTSSKFIAETFESLSEHANANGIKSMVYKCIPYIYHNIPSAEDQYALFRIGAELHRRDVSSVIDLSQRLPYTKGTKYNLAKSRKHALRVEQSHDFGTFMQIEEEILAAKYGTKPTHTASELSSLAQQFPQNIKLYLVSQQNECLGGTVIYDSGTVLHTQYIGITDVGKENGALDAIIDYLLQTHTVSHRWFSFGISTEQEGKYLNEGLIRNKESFGARAVVHDFYKLNF